MIDVNNNWSLADITNRTESIIRSNFSLNEELIILRKLIATQMGMYTMSTDEQSEVQDFFNICIQAQMAGREAKAALSLIINEIPTESADITGSTS